MDFSELEEKEWIEELKEKPGQHKVNPQGLIRGAGCNDGLDEGVEPLC
jgi:hypothetical protein